MLATIKKEKKVGIVIHDKAQLFSNGITQNAYFLKECLDKVGYTTQFLCDDENPSLFAYGDGIPMKTMSSNPLFFDPEEYAVIITVTRGISNELRDILKAHKIPYVSLICGNRLLMDIEGFVYQLPHSKGTFIGKFGKCDEVWAIESFAFQCDYLKIIRDTPAYPVPHLWSHSVMKYYHMMRTKSESDETLVYNIEKRKKNKITILIMEPNMQFLKCSWIPIVAAEQLHIKYPDLIDEVYVFNFPETELTNMMVDHLTLGKKIRRFKRLSMPEILNHFNNFVETTPIFASHQIMTNLNYLYYEALYYGFPLVHNSPELGGCGYEYSTYSVTSCADAMYKAWEHHNKNYLFEREKNLKFMERFDPLNESVGKAFDQMITNVILKVKNSS